MREKDPFLANVQKMLVQTSKSFYEEVGIKWAHERMKEQREHIWNHVEDLGYMVLILGSTIAAYHDLRSLAYEQSKPQINYLQSSNNNPQTNNVLNIRELNKKVR